MFTATRGVKTAAVWKAMGHGWKRQTPGDNDRMSVTLPRGGLQVHLPSWRPAPLRPEAGVSGSVRAKLYDFIARYFGDEVDLAVGNAPTALLLLAQPRVAEIDLHQEDIRTFPVSMPSVQHARAAYALALYLLQCCTEARRLDMLPAVGWVALDATASFFSFERDGISLMHLTRYDRVFQTGCAPSAPVLDLDDGQYVTVVPQQSETGEPVDMVGLTRRERRDRWEARELLLRCLLGTVPWEGAHWASENVRAALGLSPRSSCVLMQLELYHRHRVQRARTQSLSIVRRRYVNLPLNVRIGLGLYRIFELETTAAESPERLAAIKQVMRDARDQRWTALEWDQLLSGGFPTPDDTYV